MITLKLIKNIKANGVVPAINQSLIEWGRVLKEYHVSKLTSGSRSGRLYGTHRASAPGEYPANRSGALVRSVGVDVKNKQLTFGEGADYAKYLEHGTRNMEARPHLRRSADAKIGHLEKLFNSKITRGMK